MFNKLKSKLNNYKAMKNKATKFNKIQDYLLQNIIITTKQKEIKNSNNTTIVFKYPESSNLNINIDIKKLYELCDIKLNIKEKI